MSGERWNCCPKCGHDVERCVAGAARLGARTRALEAEVEALTAHLMRCHPNGVGCAFELDEQYRANAKAALARRDG